MGLTHYSILNQLIKDGSFIFVEPNKKINFLLKSNFDVKFFSSDYKIDKPSDITIIASPPFTHMQIVQSCINRGDKKIFVEKPFGGHSNFDQKIFSKNVFIGYVLRFNPIVRWIKSNINQKLITEVKAFYYSNTIENKPKGWRNGKFSGVLNEMGSHIIDLSNFIFNLENFSILSTKTKSLISDVDDEVFIKIKSDDKIFNYHFNWVNKNYRKPVFGFKIVNSDGTKIFFDQQKIEKISSDNIITRVSNLELDEKVPYYLRGVDFTKQMMDLIQDCKSIANLNDAYLVNKIIKESIVK